MSIRNYTHADRTPEGLAQGLNYENHFDIYDIQAAEAAGLSKSEILKQLQASGYGPDKPGNFRVGSTAWATLMAGASQGGGSSSSFGPPSGGSSSGPSSQSSSNTSDVLAYQRQLDDYRNELSANSLKLADYESQLGRYKSDLEASKLQYADVLGKYNTSTEKIGALGQELEKVKADSELNRSNLEAYKKDTISQQLDVLRRGAGTSQGPSTGARADLTSGGAAVTRAPKQSGVNVVAKIDATDSVLDRRGPVVDVMSSGSSASSSRVDARQRALAASGGGSAAGYYASRFG